ncbi:MAG: calcium/sodium antiporter [candidate division WOR-3 bacterium]
MFFLQSIIFLISLLVLIKSADFFVAGSSSIAKHFNVSQMVIGLTLVSMGTSLPEFVINIISSFSKHNEIVLGNIIGSNISNILLILGISGLINPIVVKKNTTYKEIPFSFFAAFILFIFLNDKFINGSNFSNSLSKSEGIVLLIFFVCFLYYVIKIVKVEPVVEENIKVFSFKKSLVFIVLGMVFLFISAKFLVSSAIFIARFLRISEAFISLTVVAIGTSLPELVTSAVASYKKNSDIAIGNIIGSNIFNNLFILGISSVINNVEYKTFFNFDLSVLLYSTFLLFGLMFLGKKHSLGKKGSFFMLISYIVYLYLITLRK